MRVLKSEDSLHVCVCPSSFLPNAVESTHKGVLLILTAVVKHTLYMNAADRTQPQENQDSFGPERLQIQQFNKQTQNPEVV